QRCDGARRRHLRAALDPRADGGRGGRLPAHHAHLQGADQRAEPVQPDRLHQEPGSGPGHARRRLAAARRGRRRRRTASRTSRPPEHAHRRDDAMSAAATVGQPGDVGPLVTRPAPQLPAPSKTNYLNAEYGVRSWLLTRDHKRIALLYLASVTI